MGKLPPGQKWVDWLIVYDIGPVPPLDLAEFLLRIDGEVKRPLELTWEEFLGLPQGEVMADLHCVTGWSVHELRFEGVLARTIIGLCRPRKGVEWVIAYGREGYTTNVPYGYFAREDTILAHRLDGTPLLPEHGWPLRLVVPSLYAWKSAKYLVRLEFAREKRRGYWEERGYHDVGDPWREERRWKP
ncbi:molybdopterin-dependent oxidoreductase [Candidatus Bipolaricaulota sp. J31]